jgi:hypothetical protein
MVAAAAIAAAVLFGWSALIDRDKAPLPAASQPRNVEQQVPFGPVTIKPAEPPNSTARTHRARRPKLSASAGKHTTPARPRVQASRPTPHSRRTTRRHRAPTADDDVAQDVVIRHSAATARTATVDGDDDVVVRHYEPSRPRTASASSRTPRQISDMDD